MTKCGNFSKPKQGCLGIIALKHYDVMVCLHEQKTHLVLAKHFCFNTFVLILIICSNIINELLPYFSLILKCLIPSFAHDS